MLTEYLFLDKSICYIKAGVSLLFFPLFKLPVDKYSRYNRGTKIGQGESAIDAVDGAKAEGFKQNGQK